MKSDLKGWLGRLAVALVAMMLIASSVAARQTIHPVLENSKPPAAIEPSHSNEEKYQTRISREFEAAFPRSKKIEMPFTSMLLVLGDRGEGAIFKTNDGRRFYKNFRTGSETDVPKIGLPIERREGVTLLDAEMESCGPLIGKLGRICDQRLSISRFDLKTKQTDKFEVQTPLSSLSYDWQTEEIKTEPGSSIIMIAVQGLPRQSPLFPPEYAHKNLDTSKIKHVLFVIDMAKRKLVAFVDPAKRLGVTDPQAIFDADLSVSPSGEVKITIANRRIKNDWKSGVDIKTLNVTKNTVSTKAFDAQDLHSNLWEIAQTSASGSDIVKLKTACAGDNERLMIQGRLEQVWCEIVGSVPDGAGWLLIRRIGDGYRFGPGQLVFVKNGAASTKAILNPPYHVYLRGKYSEATGTFVLPVPGGFQVFRYWPQPAN